MPCWFYFTSVLVFSVTSSGTQWRKGYHAWQSAKWLPTASLILFFMWCEHKLSCLVLKRLYMWYKWGRPLVTVYSHFCWSIAPHLRMCARIQIFWDCLALRGGPTISRMNWNMAGQRLTSDFPFSAHQFHNQPVTNDLGKDQRTQNLDVAKMRQWFRKGSSEAFILVRLNYGNDFGSAQLRQWAWSGSTEVMILLRLTWCNDFGMAQLRKRTW